MAKTKKKTKSPAAQIAAQVGGPTKGQQRIARRVQLHDELMRMPQPLARRDAARVRKVPPTKRERKITRAVQHQARLARTEVRQAKRGNITALLDATKSSRPQATDGTLTEAESDIPLRFCGRVITSLGADKVDHAALRASAAPFDPYHRVLFISGTCGKIKDSKQREVTTGVPRMRSAGAAIVYKTAPGNENDNSNAGHFWEEKLFRLSVSAGNSTKQSIEVGLRAVAEALALVAAHLACARDDGMSHTDKVCLRPKLTIFADNQAVVSKVSNINLTAGQLRSTPCLEKLITRSEYLRHLGVEVELRLSRPLQSEGSQEAEMAARRAVTSNKACQIGDSLDEGLQILIDSLEQE